MLTFEDLAGWAGAERISRADPDIAAGWRIPEGQKSLLVNVGVPVVDQLIEYVDFQADPDPVLQTTSGISLYRLTGNHHGDIASGLRWAFGAEPHTGRVCYVLPDGEAWFANSTIGHWLRTLHYYGLHVSQSPILNDADDHEDEALAELAELAQKLKEMDPPAFEGYRGFIWAEFLDRWLW
ncbi:SUKH-4 family immunity protein [Nonomuraea sp. KM90]|uniref:SUKH-4 family immunity protein n=1 Tax=Nonomuraea sp. KM90 TaxID=3457428 RepID=UPI003FCC98E0